MPTCNTYIPYNDTGYFSKLIVDYLDGKDTTRPFFTYAPTTEGLQQAIEGRQQYPIDRNILVETLLKQYEQVPACEAVQKNIRLLSKESTYTVCTAHQPNLLTGYLYFIYKIIHAIKLADELNKKHPGKRFVPVYYMGSEDNDLDELGTFRYNGDKYTWDGDNQEGAVGRMATGSLKHLLEKLFSLLGPPGPNYDALKKMLTAAYLKHSTIAAATQYLVNELFGRYGLVVLDPDEAAFKKQFIPVMEDDLLQHTAHTLVSRQIDKLSVHYKIQAHPRPINLFYLSDQLRERIERNGDIWQVVNTDITWDKEALLKDLNTHPERFSPNVILRGLYQETILPNVAFIGGGAEVAYWLQLKELFAHHHIFYPSIHLRQSVLWIMPGEAKLRKQLKLEAGDIFKDENELIKTFILQNRNRSWKTGKEQSDFELLISALKQKAIDVDPTLKASAEAALAKINYQLEVLEKKMFRAEKKKSQVQVARIEKIKKNLFPNNSLQERVENFSAYFLQYGYSFFDILKEAMQPLQSQFLIVEADD